MSFALVAFGFLYLYAVGFLCTQHASGSLGVAGSDVPVHVAAAHVHVALFALGDPGSEALIKT